MLTMCTQALRLSSEVYGGYVKVEEYSHGHHMKVVYWRPGSDQLLSAFLLDTAESESHDWLLPWQHTCNWLGLYRLIHYPKCILTRFIWYQFGWKSSDKWPEMYLIVADAYNIICLFLP